MDVIILGAGLSGITTAYFLQKSDKISTITLLEKEEAPGGLCRSISCGKYIYDIGPHILFSKDKEMLELMLSFLDEKNDLKRSNQIIYQDRWVQYPFENDLSKLPEDDLNYCINSFIYNPYSGYKPENMLQFFLSTFGEGITNSYLRPYNEKIWKYDPAYMNTSMVDRIPMPTTEEIIRSASGETVDGYTHQLYFSYPANGGIEAVIKGFIQGFDEKCNIAVNSPVEKISNSTGIVTVTSGGKDYIGDLLISTIPIQDLVCSYQGAELVKTYTDALRYNSIMVFFVKTKSDLCGENFAFLIPQKRIIFHRISKMDFLGDHYKSDGATFMVEVTFRENDIFDCMTDKQLNEAVKRGVCDIGFAKSINDVEVLDMVRRKHAYVIYDIDHFSNMKKIREYFAGQGVLLNGRFGNFEYWNMDRVLRESKNLFEKIMEQ